jgi:archaellum biogenesis ATPase FlaH
MEKSLLAASLRNRADYDLICNYIEMRSTTYSKLFQIAMKKIGEYYQRDKESNFVLPEVLLLQISESIRNDKHVTRFTELITEALASTGSDVNVRAAILMSKQQEVGDKLSQALAVDSTDPKVDTLIQQLSELRAMTSLDELTEKGLEVHHDIDLEDLLTREFDPTALIKVYPNSLNEKFDGGAKRGHHIVLFARPELGKTALSINMNAGFIRQGFKSLYIINEDRTQDIIVRHISNLSGMTKHQIRDNPRRAQNIANEAGFQNTVIVSASPGTPQQIENLVDEYGPDCVIVDQLRNLAMKAENRTNQLESAATAVRNIGKKYNALMASVTQAGDSARNKLELDDGDIDNSNTGIPAQADVLLGMGMDATLEAEGLRMLTLCKNKISGEHSSFPVRINPALSRITSV